MNSLGWYRAVSHGNSRAITVHSPPDIRARSRSFPPGQCWYLFVKACYHLCRRSITYCDIDAADQLLMEFYTKFVTLCGKDNCNPNLHLHGHICECVRDYGPVYSFRLFSIQRCPWIIPYNRNISIQLIRQFLDSRSYSPSNWPDEYFLSVLEQFNYKGSLVETFETTKSNPSLLCLQSQKMFLTLIKLLNLMPLQILNIQITTTM